MGQHDVMFTLIVFFSTLTIFKVLAQTDKWVLCIARFMLVNVAYVLHTLPMIVSFQISLFLFATIFVLCFSMYDMKVFAKRIMQICRGIHQRKVKLFQSLLTDAKQFMTLLTRLHSKVYQGKDC